MPASVKRLLPFLLFFASCGAPQDSDPPVTSAIHQSCPVTDLCHIPSTNGPLNASCSPVAAAVIAADPYCGQWLWDGQCIEEVSSIGGSNECGHANRWTWPLCHQSIFVIQGDSQNPGGKKDPGCGPTIANVCAAGHDPYCCNSAWDSDCRVEAEYLQFLGGPGSISWAPVNYADIYNGPGRCGDFRCRTTEGESNANCSIDCP